MEQTELLDKVALGSKLGVAPETVARWARQGRIPAIRISAKVRRFDYAEVLVALRSAPPAPASATPAGEGADQPSTQGGNRHG